MYKRAVSAYWKLIKKTRPLPWFSKAFALYIQNKISPEYPNIETLDKMAGVFLGLKNVRRVVNPLYSLER